MLVLTRRRDQSILIGDNVRVTVVEISGNQVRLGIEAPRMVPVLRMELARHHEPAVATHPSGGSDASASGESQSAPTEGNS